MIYFLVPVIVAALIVAITLRIKRLRPKQLTAIALANQLLRQPERFFVIVPWYLIQCRREKLEPMAFMEEAAGHWRKMGNFDLPAGTLVAFGKLESDPSEANLRYLLSLLFDKEQPNPLVIAASEPDSNQRLAVRCLEVIDLVMAMRQESRHAAKKKLPNPNEIKNLLNSAEQAEKAKDGLTLRVFGDFNDSRIFDGWCTLLKYSCSLIDHNFKQKYKFEAAPTKQGNSREDIGKGQDKKPPKEPGREPVGTANSAPSAQGYPYLHFIRQAIINSRAEQENKEAGK